MTALEHHRDARRAERAAKNFELLAKYKRVGEVMGIPPVIIEIHAERQWLDMGYDSFDEACREMFGGWWLRWPIDERRSVVTELTQKGMSTRAISSVLGISDGTVRNDQKSSGAKDYAPEIRGNDGKTYTREQVQAEQALQDMLAGDPDYREANVRKELALWTKHLAQYYLHDPTEAARLRPPEENPGLVITLGKLRDWIDAYFQAARPPMRLIKDTEDI